MTKRTRRLFSAEFKLEAAQLVLDQNYSVTEAAQAMNVGKSTMDKWVRQLREERQGKTPKASPMTPEQIEIRELKKKLARLEEHNEIFKKSHGSVDVGLTEQFLIIKKLKQSYSVKTLCEVFNVHRSSYHYWLKRPTVINAETVKLRSLVSEAHVASNGSAGARTIADIVTNQGVKLSRYRATKLMRTLGLVSCQEPKHRYRKASQEHMDDQVVDMIAGAYDVGIRIGELKDSSLIARKLAKCNSVVCASPEYLQQAGTPNTPHDLKDHNCIYYSLFQAGVEWTFFKADEKLKVEPTGNFIVNNSDAICEMLLQGLGICQMPTFIVQRYLNTGQLVQVLANYDLPDHSIFAVYPERRHMPEKVKVFIDFIEEKLHSIYWEVDDGKSS
ncbi:MULTISPECIES: LysR substrate-binding domain-containing protein [unclassified Vibrio]|nr:MULTISPECIES: LysR substrate-binding domain-containing protein [unclassified Vibrio]